MISFNSNLIINIKRNIYIRHKEKETLIKIKIEISIG